MWDITTYRFVRPLTHPDTSHSHSPHLTIASLTCLPRVINNPLPTPSPTETPTRCRLYLNNNIDHEFKATRALRPEPLPSRKHISRHQLATINAWQEHLEIGHSYLFSTEDGLGDGDRLESLSPAEPRHLRSFCQIMTSVHRAHLLNCICLSQYEWCTCRCPGLPPSSTQKWRPSHDIGLLRYFQVRVLCGLICRPEKFRSRLMDRSLTLLTHTFTSFVSLRPALLSCSMYLRKDVVLRIHDISDMGCH
ncbi:hypothetical protein H4582DRAFT_1992242 [Lactarius indigo]|nr:hypothetical protein H4582DRAFT_1992242 [Lactarius indigo]